MTRGSIREYTEAMRGRYLRATKKEQGRVLDEFTQVTGYTASQPSVCCTGANGLHQANGGGAPDVMELL